MTVTDTPLEKESQDRYLTYAISVISGRALPDVRDGLKPVQRRILFAMREYLNLTPERSHSKSAEVVGAVLAKLHPHGDIACYESMVRMAQDFSLRYPLVDGQGNFGSLDGDNAAAYRYTEVKLRPLAIELLGEINEETVDFRDNFSSITQEPVVLPSRIPNLLINGATGIAVGMATNIPPHNLRDTIKALTMLLDEPDVSETKLAGAIKGPDFPTGCSILNSRKELNDMYASGRGAVRMRADWTVEEGSRGKKYIVITSIAYATNKAQLIEKIADLIIQRKVPQLQDVRDESTEHIRVVIELTPGASAEAAMAYLYKHTTLESQFNVNLTALAPTGPNGALRPEVLSLKKCLGYFLTFREEVTRKKLEFEKRNLEARLHILEAFMIIYDALDEVIRIVRKADGRTDSAQKLRKRFTLSEIQAFAIVDLRIYQLSRTNIEEIETEFNLKSKRVKEITSILNSRAKLLGLLRADLERISETYGDKRTSKIDTESSDIEFREEDYVVQEDVYAIVTRDGWIKRIRQNNEVNQTRLREGDAILAALPLTTLDAVSFITSLGTLYVVKVSDFPSSSGYGEPLQKSLKFKDGEKLVATFSMSQSSNDNSNLSLKLEEGIKILFVSTKGVGYISTLSDLQGIKRSGRRVYKPRSTDTLAAVCLLADSAAKDKELSMVTRNGYGLRIPLSEVPEREGASVGVQLIGVRDDDALAGALTTGRGTNLVLTTGSGKEKEIPSSDIVAGHRALKGNKVLARDEITAMKLKTS